MKPSDVLAAQRYAKAYCLLDGKADVLLADLNAADAGLKNAPSLLNPTISKEVKKKFINEVFAANKNMANFLNLLIENKRLSMLSLIVREAQTIINKRLGITEISVTSAYELSEIEKENIKKAAVKFFNCNAASASFKEDKSLIGGILIKNEAVVIDASVAGGLERLKNILR